MADPAIYDILTDRNVDDVETWSFLGVDWTGSTFKMQVRATRDTSGTPLLEHSTATGSFSLAVVTDTVANHIAAGDLTKEIYGLINPATGVAYAPTDSVLLTRVRLGIIAFYLEGFPFPAEQGDDLTAFYDIIRTPVSGSAELILAGKFIVRAGVTIP